MLLSTMTYEQIHREISHDFRDVLDYYKKAVEPKVSKLACKSPFYPFRRFEFYTHPISRNNYTNVALLNLDGLCFGKRSVENHGIIIYKTFVPLNELFMPQYQKVLPQYMQMVFARACMDNPQCGKTLEKIAADGAAKCNELLPFLNNEEKLKEYFQRYQDMCQELGKYIIL